MRDALKQAIEHWHWVAPVIAQPETEDQYHELVSNLDGLLDIVGDDEYHPLMGLVDLLSDAIEKYEAEHVEAPSCTGIDALRYLMDAHGLRQSDLPEVGSQGVVSEVLSGHRKLNVRQIQALAARFKVSPATFIDN